MLAHLGRYGDALATALRSAEAGRDNIARTDERQALRYAALQRAGMDTVLSIASRPGASAAGRQQRAAAIVVRVAGQGDCRFGTAAGRGAYRNWCCKGPGSLAAAARENPPLRSGLALAGANRRQDAAPGEDDGILTAEEAASLDLEAAEWIVLSGCDTGVGDVKFVPPVAGSQSGEGVLGLRRAFQEAGARTVIASLWPVDDNAARDWMAVLYRERLQAARSTAESVRAADLSQLHSRRKGGKGTHPFYGPASSRWEIGVKPGGCGGARRGPRAARRPARS